MNDMSSRRHATPAEELLSIVKTGDALPEWCRAALGKSVQLRVPIRDTTDLRRCATILRVLVSRMETLSADHKRDSASVLFDFWSAARAAQAQLQSKPKRKI